MQRLGDIARGKRTWDEELKNNSVVPTLKSAVAGDITFALVYRTMTDILKFIGEMDKVVEGFANPDNLLYGPEIKFYSNQVLVNEKEIGVDSKLAISYLPERTYLDKSE